MYRRSRNRSSGFRCCQSRNFTLAMGRVNPTPAHGLHRFVPPLSRLISIIHTAFRYARNKERGGVIADTRRPRNTSPACPGARDGHRKGRSGFHGSPSLARPLLKFRPSEDPKMAVPPALVPQDRIPRRVRKSVLHHLRPPVGDVLQRRHLVALPPPVRVARDQVGPPKEVMARGEREAPRTVLLRQPVDDLGRDLHGGALRLQELLGDLDDALPLGLGPLLASAFHGVASGSRFAARSSASIRRRTASRAVLTLTRAAQSRRRRG